MANREHLAEGLDRFFWVFLFINPFLDILNGFYLNVIAGIGVLDVKSDASLGVTPSLVIRMLMLLVFAFYLLLRRDKLAIRSVFLIAVTWLLSIISEFLSLGRVDLFPDMQYIARFCYNIVLIFVFIRTFGGMWGRDKERLLERLDKLIAYTLVVLAASILISYLFGFGYNTYADRMGYRGSRGFFYAGNDITAVLALLLPLNLARIMRTDCKVLSLPKLGLFLLPAALGANALLAIGTKTAFIAITVNFCVMLAVALFYAFGIKNKKPLHGILLSLLAVIAVFLLMMIFSGMTFLNTIVVSFSVTGELMESEGMGAAVFSGRQYKLAEHWGLYSAGGPFTWLFGLGRGSMSNILEMDVLEVLFYYGVFGCITMLWLYAVLGAQFLLRVIRRIDITGCALVVSLAVCTAYLIMAGHILFSVTSGFYYIFTIVYSRVYLADKPKDIPILLSAKKT